MRQMRWLTIVLRLVFRYLIQGMDADIDGAPTLVHNLDHLLVLLAVGCWLLAVRNRHTNQSAKLTDTMVDMHHIVANFKLLNLLQRQRHLTRPCLVGRQTVLMVAVEDLVVSEYAEAQVVVGKTLVEVLFDGIEQNTALFCKDVAQTLQLFLAVGQDAELVAISEILLQRLLQEVEILMELGLWRYMELNGGVGQS